MFFVKAETRHHRCTITPILARNQQSGKILCKFTWNGEKFQDRMMKANMKRVRSLLVIVAVAVALASCAQPIKTAAPAKASVAGLRFNGVGKVTMHAGEPCTSQIMFDFRGTGARSTVWLSAPMRETKLLTDAANRHRRVHVWGKWQRGMETGCDYVSVTKIESLSIAIVF